MRHPCRKRCQEPFSDLFGVSRGQLGGDAAQRADGHPLGGRGTVLRGPVNSQRRCAIPSPFAPSRRDRPVRVECGSCKPPGCHKPHSGGAEEEAAIMQPPKRSSRTLNNSFKIKSVKTCFPSALNNGKTMRKE